jgi:uncharacterized protein YkwD
MGRRRGTNKLLLWLRRKRIYYRQSWVLAVVDLFKLAVGISVLVIAFSLAVGSGVPAVDVDIQSGDGPLAGEVGQLGDNAKPAHEFNESLVAQKVRQRVNDIRIERGLKPFPRNRRAAAAADAHAEDMAANAYFNHTSRSGVTAQERYSFCRGGENIAKTYVNTPLTVHHPYTNTSGTVEYTNETELARGIVRSWMNSRPHRENMLSDWAVSVGVGIAISADDSVYAVQGLCSE